MEVQALAFEEHLVRVVERNGEPWFVGKDVCAALALRNHNDALAKLDDDETGVALTDPRQARGSQQEAIIVSEPGVYRLTFSSRKPEAERFKRWLAHEILPKLRRGLLSDLAQAPSPSVKPASMAAPTRGSDVGPQTITDKLGLLREARLIHGRARAAELWHALGLPSVPDARPTLLDEARACLTHLLVCRLDDGRAVGDAVEAALDDDIEAQALLMAIGLRVMPEREGFHVPNRAAGVARLFEGTAWANGRWRHVLRRLPGVEATGPMRVGRAQSRGSVVPVDYLDLSV